MMFKFLLINIILIINLKNEIKNEVSTNIMHTFSTLYSILDLVWNGVVGFFDALNPCYSFSLYYHSTTVKRILNSVVFINGSLLLFNFVLHTIGNQVPHMSTLNWIGWFFPMWMFSDYVNRVLQNEMMEKLCMDKYSKKEKEMKEKKVCRSRQITDVLYETVFFACIHFLLFISNSYWSKTLYLIGYSLVASYSMLAYRLTYTQFSLQQKFKLFEKYWVYFIFYGLPYGMVYILLPPPISFPCFYILMAWTLPNTLNVLPRKGFILPFKIFYVPEYLVNSISMALPKIMNKKKD